MRGCAVGSRLVVGYAGLDNKGEACWVALCRDCGGEEVFTGTALRKRQKRGGVKPCSCLTPEQRRKWCARLMRLADRAEAKQHRRLQQ
jgi:hypothetical protein